MQKTSIVDRFLQLAALPTFPLHRLSRYEHTLCRQARQIVFKLESPQRRKHQPRRSRFSFRRGREQSPQRSWPVFEIISRRGDRI